MTQFVKLLLICWFSTNYFLTIQSNWRTFQIEIQVCLQNCSAICFILRFNKIRAAQKSIVEINGISERNKWNCCCVLPEIYKYGNMSKHLKFPTHLIAIIFLILLRMKRGKQKEWLFKTTYLTFIWKHQHVIHGF